MVLYFRKILPVLHKLALLFLACFLALNLAYAQENLHFSVDRPGIADLPSTVPVGYLQMETGIEYYRRENYGTLFLPTMLLRSGITKDIEARLTARYLRIDSLKDGIPAVHEVGLGFDVKAKFIHEKGFLPSAAFVVEYHFVVKVVLHQ